METGIDEHSSPRRASKEKEAKTIIDPVSFFAEFKKDMENYPDSKGLDDKELFKYLNHKDTEFHVEQFAKDNKLAVKADPEKNQPIYDSLRHYQEVSQDLEIAYASHGDVADKQKEILLLDSLKKKAHDNAALGVVKILHKEGLVPSSGDIYPEDRESGDESYPVNFARGIVTEMLKQMPPLDRSGKIASGI